MTNMAVSREPADHKEDKQNKQKKNISRSNLRTLFRNEN